MHTAECTAGTEQGSEQPDTYHHRHCNTYHWYHHRHCNTYHWYHHRHCNTYYWYHHTYHYS